MKKTTKMVRKASHVAWVRLASTLCLAALVGACSDSSNNSNSGDSGSGGVDGGGEPFAELIDSGIARYLGLYTPMTSETLESGVVAHTFGAGDGPLCLDGSEYRMGTFNQGSDELVIFLQGGGACWSTLCSATESAESGIPQVGILDPAREDNPVKSWNQVYLPYCDGGLHASDADNDYDGDGTPETRQRGLHNLSASLDVAVNAFPSPSRILLTGASAGAYGTTFALPLVRHLYPDVPIELVNDSGVGIGIPDDQSYLMLLMSDWNQSAFIPEDCSGLPCLGEDGHLSDYQSWQLDVDTLTRRSYLSSKQDSVIALGFLQIGGPAHEAALIPELADMEVRHPDRVRSWVVDGSTHTYVQRDPEATSGVGINGGVSVFDFIRAQLDDSPDWVSVSD
ncbi:pectin acetylesterase-family hydrolase [Candidatus Marimicrobium litorale]|uniref:VtpJ-therm n=1 Tax=Candidatus Marimicrobium litorale TaxID=2518991 RepID=A0ABT3TB86_9GAMM|nr:pectin acetylesterase-family hydrolase [Candidatus Marimicrobium litorale]MCX2978719.1 vtpJ-therm [Candidatus Marimicrobium litorale]